MGGKQKVVVRVPCCVKGRSIAFRAAAGVPGLSSVSLEGAEKDLVVLIGEDIDSYGLIKSLKRKVKCVKLLTVGPVEEKRKPPPEKKPKSISETDPCLCRSIPCFCHTVPRLCRPEHVIYVCESCNQEPICVIM